MGNGSMYRRWRCTGCGTAPQPWPSACGTDLKTGQDQLGHSTITLTAATCTSVLPKTARAAANTPALLVPRQPRARHGSETCGQADAQAASSGMGAAGPQKVAPRGVTPARHRHPGAGVRYLVRVLVAAQHSHLSAPERTFSSVLPARVRAQARWPAASDRGCRGVRVDLGTHQAARAGLRQRPSDGRRGRGIVARWLRLGGC